MSRTSLGPAWVMVGGALFFTTAAQVFFKLAGLNTIEQTGFTDAWILNLWLWAAFAAYTVSVAFWLFALRYLPLSLAYPWTAMVYVLVPLISWILFNDVLSLRYLLGMTCIVGGIFITNSGMSKCR